MTGDGWSFEEIRCCNTHGSDMPEALGSRDMKITSYDSHFELRSNVRTGDEQNIEHVYYVDTRIEGCIRLSL